MLSVSMIIIIAGTAVGGVGATLGTLFLSKFIKSKSVAKKAERINDDFREEKEEKIFANIQKSFESLELFTNDLKNHFGGVGTQSLNTLQNDINELKKSIADLEAYDEDELKHAVLQKRASKRNITHKASKFSKIK